MMLKISKHLLSQVAVTRQKWIPPLIMMTLLLSGGCKDQVIVYHIPKETSEKAANTFPLVTTLLTPIWEAPKDWEPQTLAPDAMRKAAWRIANTQQSMAAEVTVVSFPGEVGDISANVARWRRQISLEPLNSEALAEATQAINIGGFEAFYTFLKGRDTLDASTQPQSILACSVKPDAHTWFFKMKGDAPLIAAQQKTFRAFLKTIRFEHLPSHPPVEPQP